MIRRISTLVLFSLLQACGIFVVAQNPTVAHSAADLQSPSITLGQSSLPLTGPWKFQTGDSPLDPATHKHQWSEPGFDDSRWGTIDLTPPAGTYNRAMGTSGFVPGWTAQGHPGWSGYAWYRTQVDIKADDLQKGNSDRASRLALKMPDDFEDAYQVFANGQLIGEFGTFTPNGVEAYQSQPHAFLLPADIKNGPVKLAIRVWMDSGSLLSGPAAGGLHAPPVLGQAPVIMAMQVIGRKQSLRYVTSNVIEIFILLIAGGVAFVIFWLDRTDKAFLWLGLICMSLLVLVTVFVLVATSTVIGVGPYSLSSEAAESVQRACGVVFWAVWFRTTKMRRLHLIVWPLAFILFLCGVGKEAPLAGQFFPLQAAAWLSRLEIAVESLFSVILIWVTVQGIRKDRIEGLLALPAVAMVVVSGLQMVFDAVHLPTSVSPFGIFVPYGQIGTILTLSMVTVLMLRRFYLNQRERQILEQEVEQARQVQRVIVPQEPVRVQGFTIESEYLPARQVSGDFFQIIPIEKDASLLIVAGDVTGKGLKAGMLAALLVGTIRTAVYYDPDPLAVLKALNQGLLGSGNAQATCLALRIEINGATILANAGHMTPYLNGEPLAMEGALPLGIVDSAEFSVMRFKLNEHDRLMLMSDGIAEAIDANGKLFGFERIHELLRQATSAAEVAAAAQRFGQEDDISVISITRTGALNSALA
jgi:hypothetical protein